jgi:hypothetical protein
MNKLEAEYEQAVPREETARLREITLKLGDDCRYTPDFWSQEADDTITISRSRATGGMMPR